MDTDRASQVYRQWKQKESNVLNDSLIRSLRAKIVILETEKKILEKLLDEKQNI